MMKLNFDAVTRHATTAPARQAQQTEQAAPEAPTLASPSCEDKLELSQEALAYLQGQQEAQEEAPEETLSPEEKRRQAQAERLKLAGQMLDMLKQQSAQMKEQSEKQADALKKALDKMKKCMRIARNIGKGHKVPPEDEKYLLENDAKAYMMAMVMRMMEEQKEKVKSELDEEDRQGEAASAESASADGAVEAAGPEISPVSGLEPAPEASVE